MIDIDKWISENISNDIKHVVMSLTRWMIFPYAVILGLFCLVSMSKGEKDIFFHVRIYFYTYCTVFSVESWVYKVHVGLMLKFVFISQY